MLHSQKLFALILLSLVACVRAPESVEPATIVPSLTDGQRAYLTQLDPQQIMFGPGETVPEAPTANAATNPANACEDFRTKIPKNYLQGTLEVPEDPAKPDGIKIKVFYYGRAPEAGQTPVVFFNGGPASHSHGAFVTLALTQTRDPVWKTIPFMFIDQRGNGCSSPYPQIKTAADLERLRHYGARGIVQDAEAVRQHLFGARPWKIFGQSYGASIVHRYATLYPRSIAAAYAHGSAITPDNFERLVNRIEAQNRVLEKYFESYPGDRKHLETLTTRLTKDRCYKDAASAQKICGLRTLDSFNTRLAFRNQWETMHRWIERLATDDKSFAEFLQKFAFGPISMDRVWAERVIDAYDRGVPPIDRANCTKYYEALTARGSHPERSLLNECVKHLQFAEPSTAAKTREQLAKLLETYGNDILKLDDFVKARAETPLTPFYLYSGELDTMVPKTNFVEEVAAAGPLVTYENFKETGHDGYVTESRVWNDVAKPSAAPIDK